MKNNKVLTRMKLADELHTNGWAQL